MNQYGEQQWQPKQQHNEMTTKKQITTNPPKNYKQPWNMQLLEPLKEETIMNLTTRLLSNASQTTSIRPE